MFWFRHVSSHERFALGLDVNVCVIRRVGHIDGLSGDDVGIGHVAAKARFCLGVQLVPIELGIRCSLSDVSVRYIQSYHGLENCIEIIIETL